MKKRTRKSTAKKTAKKRTTARKRNGKKPSYRRIQAQKPLRDLWPANFQVDDGIYRTGIALARLNRKLTRAQVDKAAGKLIHKLFGRNAIVPATATERIKRVLWNEYEAARQERTPWKVRNPLPPGKRIAVKAIRIIRRGGRRLLQVWK